ncbi:probable serine/threonine-protein kinase DDB_G0267514 [Hydractinia symbiolongicarpus]|uniref:probable serine/threonine-protein kinase DDB_G0267514 n=1 Tax=Hydractinia symbiolongicarpus TaxID=13093 RepID=UPI00254A7DF6|nr:probable serine/threonine-protein kinase DDB_G0267514 [Hydractinia symbiolongicarpus]
MEKSSEDQKGHSETRTYVDNSQNRSLGRVGLPVGSKTVSKTGKISATYADNAKNRHHGRVGLPLGSKPISSALKHVSKNTPAEEQLPSTSMRKRSPERKKKNTASTSKQSDLTDKHIISVKHEKQKNHEDSVAIKTFLDDPSSLKPANGNDDVLPNPAVTRTYVDNPQNRRLGRVGLPVGSKKVSKNGTVSATYVDSSFNRYHDRVGLPLGSKPVSKGFHPTRETTSSKEKTFHPQHNQPIAQEPINSPVFDKSKENINVSKVESKSCPSDCKRDDTYLDVSLAAVESFPRTRSSPTTQQPVRDDQQLEEPSRRSNRYRRDTPSSTSQSSESLPTSVAARKYRQSHADNPQHSNACKEETSFPDEGHNHNYSFNQQEKKWVKSHYQQLKNGAQENSDSALYEFGKQLCKSQQNTMETVMDSVNRANLWKEKCDLEDNGVPESFMSTARQIAVTRTTEPIKSEETRYIRFNDIVIGQKIGQGKFGKIYAGKWASKKTFAIKKISFQSDSISISAQFRQLMSSVLNFSHENVVKLYCACVESPNLCFLMEFMEGSLYDHLYIMETQFNDIEKTFIIREISCGLAYLHSNDIAHGYVNLKNVLLNTYMDDITGVKISDFGLYNLENFRWCGTNRKQKTHRLTITNYSAPEVLLGKDLDLDGVKRADIYSFGLIMYEIFHEVEPFENLTTRELKTLAENGSLLPEFKGFSIDNRSIYIMKYCFDRQPSKRPSSHECYNLLEKKITP